MYAVNMEQHAGGPAGSVYENRFDVDEHYVSEMKDRALVLADDPLRCQSLPHMTLAGWDLLELIMVSKSEDYPDLFTLHRDGDKWRWINKPLGIIAANSDRWSRRTLLACDTAQTFPSFVYLIPAIMLFGITDIAVIFSILIFTLVPLTRYTIEGLRSVPSE